MNLKPINIARPVNRSHRLARGLELWWLGLDHIARGNFYWHDIAKSYHGELLSILDPGGTRCWSRAISPAAMNGLKLDGTSGNCAAYYATQIPCLGTGSTAYTVSGVARRTATGKILTPFGAPAGTLGFGELFLTGGTLKVSCPNTVASGTSSVTDDTNWHHYTLVYNGAGAGNSTRCLAYLDGRALTLSFTGIVLAALGVINGWVGVGGRQQLDATNASDGIIADFKVHSYAMTADQVGDLYRETMSGHPGLLQRTVRQNVRLSVPLYTGAVSLTGGSTSLLSIDTFSPGTKTASVALSGQKTSLASSATFSPGAHTATVGLSGQKSSLSSTDTFSPGTKTVTGSLLAGSSTLTSVVTHVTPTYSASVALNTLGSVLGASATFSPGTKTAGVSLTGTNTTLAANVAHVTPTYTGIVGLTGTSTVLASADTFSPGTKTAVVSLLTKTVTLSTNLVNTNPVYSATVSLSGTKSVLTSSVTFGVGGPKTASVTLTGGLTSLTISTTFGPGTKTAGAVLSSQPSFLTTTATFSPGVHTSSVGLVGSSTLLNSTIGFVASGARMLNLRRMAAIS